ncbi:MAG: transglutaminase family protein [Patescibacteria group bacterium]
MRFLKHFMLLLFCQPIWSYAKIDFNHLHRAVESKIDIATVSLNLAKEVYPDIELKTYLIQVDFIARRVGKIVNGSKDPDYRIRAINTVLFQELNFSYDLEDPLGMKPENRFINKTLETKKGNCYTLPLLYISIAQRLGYPIYPVLAPEHIFARYESPPLKSSNIEVTARGGEATDEQYIRDFKIPRKSIESGAYLSTLTYKEYLSELFANSGAYWAGKKEFRRAENYTAEAIRFRENTPESHMLMAKLLNGELIDKKMTVTQDHPIGRKIHEHKLRSLALGLVTLPKEEYLKTVSLNLRKP